MVQVILESCNSVSMTHTNPLALLTGYFITVLAKYNTKLLFGRNKKSSP